MICYTNKHQIPFLIDDEKWEEVSLHSWSISALGYPCTNVPSIRSRSGEESTPLHLILFGRSPAGLEWDHINRDKLDNRCQNLRQVTRVINLRNTGLQRNNKSNIRGVCYSPKVNRPRPWLVQIGVNGKYILIGSYATFDEAVEARRQAEEHYWGVNR